MKIHLYLKNGRVMQLDECTANDFKLLVETFKGMKQFFTWNERLWIRKSEVLGFELIEEQVAVAPPVVS